MGIWRDSKLRRFIDYFSRSLPRINNMLFQREENVFFSSMYLRTEKAHRGLKKKGFVQFINISSRLMSSPRPSQALEKNYGPLLKGIFIFAVGSQKTMCKQNNFFSLFGKRQIHICTSHSFSFGTTGSHCSLWSWTNFKDLQRKSTIDL